MKWALSVVGIALAVFVLLAIVTATSLVGEVVTLHTRGAEGEWETTPLWVVDASDGAYLRAGDPASGWVERLRADPEARLERAGSLHGVRLIEKPSMQQRVNEQMAEKYGWADGFVGLMADRSLALPLQIEPAGPTQ